MSGALKEKIIKFFYQYLPNPLLEEHIIFSKEFASYPREQVTECLNALVADNILQNRIHHIDKLKITRVTYRLTESGTYPIEPYLKIGSLLLPRMLEGDTARSEDVNQALLSVARVAEEVEAKLVMQFKSQLQEYWSNLITIFGLFLAIFSFIITTAPKIAQDSKLQGWDRFVQNFVDIVPLAIILFAFVWLLKHLFHNK